MTQQLNMFTVLAKDPNCAASTYVRRLTKPVSPDPTFSAGLCGQLHHAHIYIHMYI